MNIKEHVPILQWLPNYKKSWFKGDLYAGLTIGVILIPQGIAYAIIAGLPPIYGLYTALIPQIVYAFLGTSRQLAVGPAAMDSLIVASGIGLLAAMGTEHFIVLAILLAFMVGFFQFLFGIFHLGFLVNFLSRPVISGFTSGSAIIIALNQLGNFLGVDLDRSNQVQTIIIAISNEIEHIHWLSFLLGILTIATILILKNYNKKIPGSLIVVILSILSVYFFGFESKGVDVLGEIPRGLPKFSIPSFDRGLMEELSGLALTLGLIGFMEAISIGKSIEAKHNNYRIGLKKRSYHISKSKGNQFFIGPYPVIIVFSLN